MRPVVEPVHEAGLGCQLELEGCALHERDGEGVGGQWAGWRRRPDTRLGREGGQQGGHGSGKIFGGVSRRPDAVAGRCGADQAGALRQAQDGSIDGLALVP